MATREGTCKTADFMCVSILPDVCKSPVAPVPYPIVAYFNTAVSTSPNVRFHGVPAFHERSRLATVIGDEPGTGGGVVSAVNKGFCRPVGGGLFSTTVRVNGSNVDCHLKTLMHMNCAGPEGPGNTIGQVVYTATMQPGPVAPGGRIPKSTLGGLADVISENADDINKLAKNAKTLYDVAQTDWSNPAAVLGSIGAVAGFAGWEGIKDLAGKAGLAYKAATNDWSDLGSTLGALSGLAALGDLQHLGSALSTAATVAGVIKTDWGNPMAALMAAKNIAQLAGLDDVAKDMLIGAFSDGKANQQPPSNSTSSASCPPTPAATEPPPAKSEKLPVTQAELDYMQATNQVAFDWYNQLPEDVQKRVLYEGQGDQMAFYIPGAGFSSTQEERDGLSQFPMGLLGDLEELFVAGKTEKSETGFFGIKYNSGTYYLFGGLVDLGSPEMPGAGNASAWWVPDRILWADMSPYYDYHDLNYYGENVTLGDLGEIFKVEAGAFAQGIMANPFNLPFQAIYSAATSTVGVGTAIYNSGANGVTGIANFFSDVFGSGGAAASMAPNQLRNCVPLGRPGAKVGGSGAGSAGAGSTGGLGGPAGGKPGSPKVAVAGGAASGAGTDGILVTIGGGGAGSAGGGAALTMTSFDESVGKPDPKPVPAPDPKSNPTSDPKPGSAPDPKPIPTPDSNDSPVFVKQETLPGGNKVDVYRTNERTSSTNMECDDNGNVIKAQIFYGTNKNIATEANEMTPFLLDERDGKFDCKVYDKGRELTYLEVESRSDQASIEAIDKARAEFDENCGSTLSQLWNYKMCENPPPPPHVRELYVRRKDALDRANAAILQGDIEEAKRIAASNSDASTYIMRGIEKSRKAAH